MKYVYSVYDNKSKSYGPLFAVGHDAVATREFGAVMSQPDCPFVKYPDDFELHRLGEFNDAGFAPDEMPLMGYQDTRVVITARQWLDAQPKKPESQLSLLEA